ncbi:MAG: hypothetical protein FJ005_06085 [Chloroflexi bacterium]|nr:hypothetical protein [Chloroflexota bacterium]
MEAYLQLETKISELDPLEPQTATTKRDEKRNNGINGVFRQYHPQCNLCDYAGFSKKCNFISAGKCTAASKNYQ